MTHAPEGYDCPFCRLANGDLTADSLNQLSDIVLQTDSVTVFVAPAWWTSNPGHVLIIPNRHYENIYSLPAAEAASVQEAARPIALAMKSAYACDGVSTRQHNEPAGNQDVWHYHLHVFPRYVGDKLYRNDREKRWTTREERLPFVERLRVALACLPGGSSTDAPKKPVVVIFRSRLRPEAVADFNVLLPEIADLARAQPGIVSFKTFTATDGERVTIVECESHAALDAWREQVRHREAQKIGRARFYEEYRLQVADVVRDYGFERGRKAGDGDD